MRTRRAMHAIPRARQPEEIGEAAAYLASDAASFMTGQCLTLDGGYTVGGWSPSWLTKPNKIVLANVGHVLTIRRPWPGGRMGGSMRAASSAQVYRFGLSDKSCDQFARVAGGFRWAWPMTPIAMFTCDERLRRSSRITPGGAVSVYAKRQRQQKMRVPDSPVFDDDGDLFVSESGDFGAKNGFIWRVAPGGAATIRDRSQTDSRTACACRATAGALPREVVPAASSPRSRSAPMGGRPPHRRRGTAPQVPDGVALDCEGNLYIAMYTPNIIYRWSERG